jgi:hypothetical protein
VFAHSGGIPRLINLLCDLALVYAYAGQAAVVTGELIEQVVSEREQHGALPVFAVAAESRTVQQLSLKRTQASAAVNMTEAVAAHGARHAATPRLVGEASRVPATEEKNIMTRPGTDTVKARVHTVKSVPAREEQQPGPIPESNAPVMNPVVTESREAVLADDAEIIPAPVTAVDPQRVERRTNRTSDTLPVPSPVPARRAAADRRVRAWRYIAAGVLVLLISAAVLAWQFLDRSDLTLAAPARTAPARVSATTQAPGRKPVEVAPASAPSPATQPVPTASPMPQTAAAPAVPGKVAAEKARLNQIQRERDAALAAAEAAAREREALRNAALARERALAAEHEAALTRERERAQQLTQAAELAILQAHAEEVAAEVKAAELAASTPEVKADEAPATQATGGGLVSQDTGVEATAEISDAKAAAAFTTNPCKGPSARFLSTCE